MLWFVCVFIQKSCLLLWCKIKIWQLSLWLVFSPIVQSNQDRLVALELSSAASE